MERLRRRRTQCDYNMAFKLAVVAQVERGEMTYRQAQAAYGIQGRSTVLKWLRRHGTMDWRKANMSMPRAKETPAQKIKRLERELSDEKLKTEILNRMIDISDREYGTTIRKKYLSEQSDRSSRREE